MKKSESISKLAMALSKAQAEMPVVRMNAQNPFLKNKYADLGAVIETSRPILAKYGLSVSQFPTSEADKIGVTSILIHESGEYIEDSIFIPASDSKGLSVAQSAGVVISYLRRYSWASMLGLYADEDTDGHAVTGKTTEQKKPASETKTVTDETVTDDMWKKWEAVYSKGISLQLRCPTLDRSKVKASSLLKIQGDIENQIKSKEGK